MLGDSLTWNTVGVFLQGCHPCEMGCAGTCSSTIECHTPSGGGSSSTSKCSNEILCVCQCPHWGDSDIRDTDGK